MSDVQRPPIRPLLDLVVIDCPDARALAEFYAGVLGWDIEPGGDEGWAVAVHPEGGVSSANPGGRTALGFQQIQDWTVPSWPGGEHPQQFHLDFAVPDIDAAKPAVLALGARVHDHQPSESGSFRVYVDPVGHPFCLCRQADQHGEDT